MFLHGRARASAGEHGRAQASTGEHARARASTGEHDEFTVVLSRTLNCSCGRALAMNPQMS